MCGKIQSWTDVGRNGTLVSRARERKSSLGGTSGTQQWEHTSSQFRAWVPKFSKLLLNKKFIVKWGCWFSLDKNANVTAKCSIKEAPQSGSNVKNHLQYRATWFDHSWKGLLMGNGNLHSSILCLENHVDRELVAAVIGAKESIWIQSSTCIAHVHVLIIQLLEYHKISAFWIGKSEEDKWNMAYQWLYFSLIILST